MKFFNDIIANTVIWLSGAVNFKYIQSIFMQTWESDICETPVENDVILRYLWKTQSCSQLGQYLS